MVLFGDTTDRKTTGPVDGIRWINISVIKAQMKRILSTSAINTSRRGPIAPGAAGVVEKRAADVPAAEEVKRCF